MTRESPWRKARAAPTGTAEDARASGAFADQISDQRTPPVDHQTVHFALAFFS